MRGEAHRTGKVSPLTAVLVVMVLVLGVTAGYFATTAPTVTRTEVRTVTAPGVGQTLTLTVERTIPVTVVTTRVVTAEPTRIEYTIGFAMAVSGPYAVDGPVRRDGGILAIEHINSYLESVGSPVRFRFVHDDTKGTAADALRVVQSMYAAGIRVVVGPFASGEVRGIMDFVNTNKMVVISPSSTSPLLAATDYVFRVVPTDLFQAEVLAQLMNRDGIRKVGIIARNDDYGRGLSDAFERIFTTQYRGTVRKLLYTVGQPDYASEVSSLSSIVAELGIGPETAVLIIAFEDDGLNILGHARLDARLPRVRWYGSETLRRPAAYLPAPDGRASPDVARFLTDVKLTGVFASPRGGPLAGKFESDYRAKFGREPSPYAYFTYDAVWVAALAILYAGRYDADAIKAALPIAGERLIGVTGYKAFDANGDAMGSDYTIWQYRLVGGKYTFADIGTWRYPARVIEYFG
ncbi:MAG: ABC transporter substrate-binding protein [Thaumarchaeota archaeon]|nr:ABC transporter substrate-binding protein [Candidatus Calditenuaceae archaeon]MDW8041925.1 ABC transporter substrate-binding protein [Nitrososphaerota archaeon]